jgi:hypothetical protein
LNHIILTRPSRNQDDNHKGTKRTKGFFFFAFLTFVILVFFAVKLLAQRAGTSPARC